MTLEFSQELVERVLEQRGRYHSFPTLEPRKTALVVIDMQEAFVNPASPFCCSRSAAIVPVINHLAQSVRKADGDVVWIKSTYGPEPADDWPVFFQQVLGPETASRFRAALTRDAPSHALWRGLDHKPSDLIVEKNRFSAFVGSRGKLEALLRLRCVDTVLITGTVTSVCCESTAREAAMLDFRVIMISDANAGRSEAEDRGTFATIFRSFGDVMNSAEVIRLLGGAESSEGGSLSPAESPR